MPCSLTPEHCHGGQGWAGWEAVAVKFPPFPWGAPKGLSRLWLLATAHVIVLLMSRVGLVLLHILHLGIIVPSSSLE